MNQPDSDSKQPKERQKCPYGFSCGAMMMQPGIIAEHCENLTECVSLSKSEGIPWDALNQPTFDIVVYRQEREEERERRRIAWERERREREIAWEAGREERERRQREWQEELQRVRMVMQVTQHQAAMLMLKQRGNCQQYSDYAIADPLSEIIEAADHLQGLLPELESYDQGYIAPDGVEACIYSVKRPPTSWFPEGMSLRKIRQEQRIYHYHKLLSKTAQFQAVTEDEEGNPKRCKVIHLSHADDARNIQGRLGLERRNRLSQVQTRLARASRDLIEAIAIIEDEFSYDDILMQSREAENAEEQPTSLTQTAPEQDNDRNS